MRVRLTDICTPKQWKTIPTSELLSEGYPVYGANGIIGYYSEYNHESPVIAITCRGATCGAINITAPKSYVTGNAMCLDNTRSDVLLEYLYYCLLHYDFHNVISGSAQPQITRQGLEKVSVELHSLDEQRKIIDVLNTLEAIILARKNELQKLDELIKARFVELFGDIHEPSKWEKKPWSEVVTIQNGRDYKNILVESGGYPVYGTGGEMARVSEYLCPENTIIVGRKGTINNPLLVKEKFWNVDTAFGVIVGNKLHYQYFYNFCKMFDFSTLNKQAVLPSTTKADLLKIKIAVPPMELQNQFADFVKQVDKSKVAIQKSLDLYQELFDKLMNDYFGD